MPFWTAWGLRSKDPKARENAAEELGRSKSRSAVKPLIAALNDPDEHVRMIVVRALGEIGDPRAADPLLKLLQVSLGRRSEWAYYIPYMAQALGKIGDRRAIEPLTDLLKHPKHSVREEAARALVRFGDRPTKSVVELLVDLLDDPDEEVRQYAAEELGGRSDARAVARLVQALKDRRFSAQLAAEPGRLHRAQEAAAEALVKIGAPSVQPLMLELQTEDLYLRRAIRSALFQITGKKEFEVDLSKPVLTIFCVHCGRSNAETEMGPDIGWLGAIYAQCSECYSRLENQEGLYTAGIQKRIGSYPDEQRARARRTRAWLG